MGTGNYDVIGAVVYTPKLTETIKNGSPVTLVADLSGYELRGITDGKVYKVYFPSPSDALSDFGKRNIALCYYGEQGSGGTLAQIDTGPLIRIDSQRASLTFTPPMGTRSISIWDSFMTLAGSETSDPSLSNRGGYVRWGAPDTDSLYPGYWTAEDPYSAVGTPQTPTLTETISRDTVTLLWGAGSDGENNSVTGYDVQYAESTDGST